MKKITLIETVATKAHLTKKGSKEVIDVFLNEIRKSLSKGEKVVLSGFGTFKSTFVNDKDVIYPTKDHERHTIKGHRVARFTPGRSLKKAVK